MLGRKLKPEMVPLGIASAASPVDPGAVSPMAMPHVKPPKPGFNDPGGLGEKLGTLGSYILAATGNPAGGAFLDMQMQRQRQMQAEQLYERRRADEWGDFLRKAEYERANPRPVNNDTVADYNFIAERLGPEDARNYLKNKTLPPMMAVDVANPDGSMSRQFYPRGGVPGAQSGGPAVGMVKNGFRFKGGNPNDKASWEPVEGGAGSGSPRPFPQ